MNILTIEPNLVKKTARITGKVAVGELVDVVIDDVSEINSESLRLRVFCAGRVIAQYPAPGKAESFGEDGDDLTCSMRFDSVEARRMCIGRETPVLLVLEDIGDNAQLYFTQEWSLKGWPGIDTDEKPSDFSVYAFPTLVTKWTKELEDAKSAYDSHAGSKDNPHEVTKYQVGLGRVDNTSDSEKPVSVATASAIDAEKRRAESMESNLLETVKSETAARISGDDGLRRLVEAEKTRAMDAEAAVSAEAAGALSAESERAFAEESRIADLVGAETERAMSAEKGNDDAIEAEAARAKEKESQIEGMVDAERERATAREDELRYALTHESAYLRSLIDALDAVRFEVVSALPASGEDKTIYLVPNGGTGTNIKDEYLWVDGKWEKIGTTDVDLSEYLKKTDQAADSAKLGGVEADKYALKTALANKITNYGHSQEIRFLDAPDGGNVVFGFNNGPIDRVLIASVGDGESIEFDWIEGDEGKVLYVKDIATKDAVATAQQTAETATLSAGNAYTTAMAANSTANTALNVTNALTRATDALERDKLDKREAENIIPKRVSNDTDTVRIDGEGNVYALEVPKSMYFIVDKGWGGGTDLQEWTLYSSGNGVWKWSNNGAYSSNSYYITYDASAGTLSAYYASGGYSRTITVEEDLDPTEEGVDFGGLEGLTVAQYSCSYVPKTNQRSEPPEPTDRLARESQVEEGLTPLAEGSLDGISDYLLNDCVIISGVVVLSRDAVNRIDMSGVSSIALQYPTETGRVRDFVVVFDNVSGSPNIDFGTIEIVTDDASVLEVGAGTNVMSFTEISAGRFMVSRRVVEEVA